MKLDWLETFWSGFWTNSLQRANCRYQPSFTVEMAIEVVGLEVDIGIFYDSAYVVFQEKDTEARW